MSEEQKEQIGEMLADGGSENKDSKVEQFIKNRKNKKAESEEGNVDSKEEEKDGVPNYQDKKGHKVIDEESEEPKKEEAPKKKEEPEKAEEGESEEDEDSRTKAEIELEKAKQREQALLSELDKMYSQDFEGKPAKKEDEQPEPEVEVEPKKAAEPENLKNIPNIKFIKEEEAQEMGLEADKFNKILNKVYKMGLSNMSKYKEDMLSSVPDIVSKQVARQSTIDRMVDDFYKRNEDLRQYRSYVGTVANQIQAKNPDLGIQKLFEETEREVRDRLNITKRSQEKHTAEKPEEDPSFAKAPGAREEKESIPPTQKEINEMINLE